MTVEKDALIACCKSYENTSNLQQEMMKQKDKEIRRQDLKIKKLEKIIINNLKNGKNFI